MDTDIVTVFTGGISSSSDAEPNTSLQSTTKNVCLHCYDAPALPDIVYCAECLKAYQDEYEASLLHSCHLCWRHADFHYEHPLLDTIRLCKPCQRSMTPLGFLALLRRGMPGNESLHAQFWIARHTARGGQVA